ncbi:hypothetical protein CFBP5507_14530 [Agrobacterium salinitolerans]|uniref:Uncharacterized protein n=1 Tax=Agrobacterium salinitolerans TaxID=1183413 RepID=A0A4Z1QVI1_9HYPH|nr:hypothetical protein [Agrobacterium salinitolerans]UYZ07415.1 hypothetical protein CFBP5507_14530 [Agrobacterium salinitolerans]
MNGEEGWRFGEVLINWDKYGPIYGLINRIAMWVLWVAGAATLLLLVLFPSVYVISWTVFLGSRAGWWRLPQAEAEENQE